MPAGLVVFLVAVLLCLGIVMASGAPLFSGIIAGIAGGIVLRTLLKVPEDGELGIGYTKSAVVDHDVKNRYKPRI